MPCRLNTPDLVAVTFFTLAASWMVRIGAPSLLRTDTELAIYGRYCVSRRLREEGFDFLFPDLTSALRDLIGPEDTARR
jgi:hypothetical protein